MRFLFIQFLLLLFLNQRSKGNNYATKEWLEYLQTLTEINEMYGKPEYKVTRPRAIGTDYFNVSFTSPPQAINVHSLRPQDIDVVGALGDSITAGTGIDANTVAGLGIQFRGLSWTVGGEESLETSITVPNILRHFNPEVKGHSVGNKIDFELKEEDWFNVAVPGARAKDLPEQTRQLIDRMKADSRTSFENDWKLISIFIGGNDLCDLGGDPDGAAPETYRDEIRTALDMMHAELPRALVQIVQIMEIYVLPQVSDGYGASPVCGATQQAVCGHVINSVKNNDTLTTLKELNWEYQRLVEELVGSGRYDTRDDFTVAIQPFLKDTVLPYTEDGEVDATYFAPDCFHFSSKGHALGALNVWNNMFEREGEKSTVWGISDLNCPTEDSPYIFTSMNSKKEDEPTIAPLVCSDTPDWAVGLLCALAALFIIQLLVLVMLLNKNKKKQEKSSAF